MTPRGRSLTEEEIDRARSERASGKSYHEIAALFGVSYNAVRRKLDDDFRIQANESAKRCQENRRYEGSTGVSADVDRTRRQVPPDVLLERERATRADVSLTAAILGDPLPGRSALDKKRSEAGS